MEFLEKWVVIITVWAPFWALYGCSFWFFYRLMRAVERLADTAQLIATKYVGITGRGSESFRLPGDAEKPTP